MKCSFVLLLLLYSEPKYKNKIIFLLDLRNFLSVNAGQKNKGNSRMYIGTIVESELKHS